jgi:hypothetical protein
MSDWKDIGSNIIKLEGYGLYVTYIDSEVFISEMLAGSGHPNLDPDGCISWDKLFDPPNQKFLNLVNARFGTSLTMNDFGKVMRISDIKGYVAQQKETKCEPMTDAQAVWFVKNLREKDN